MGKISDTIRKQMIKDAGGCCELCGSNRNLEVHHLIPRCCAIEGSDLDLNDKDNLIVVCGVCHAKLTPKTMLTKYGQQKTIAKNNRIKQINAKMAKFYALLDPDVCGRADMPYVFDVVEYVFYDTLCKEEKEKLKNRLPV